MNKPRNKIDFATFHKMCEWLKRQPQPITLTQIELANAYHADTGTQVAVSAMKQAIDVTEVQMIFRKKNRPEHNHNRVTKIVSIIRKLVDKLENDLGVELLPEQDKNYLQQVANGKPKVTPQ